MSQLFARPILDWLAAGKCGLELTWMAVVFL
jgi:hypothetical protein